MAVRVFIVEDNLFASEDLKYRLEAIGYHVTGTARNKREATEGIGSEEKPDILIVDIELENGESGVDWVREEALDKELPVIFLTGKTDLSSVKGAIKTNPVTYLVKPLNFDELVINIDLALAKPSSNNELKLTSNTVNILKDSIFIPDNQAHRRIDNKDIMAVEADGSYVIIHTKNRKFHLSSNLKNFMAQFEDPSFLRVSRKYLVNTEYIQGINGNTLYLDGMEVVISKDQRSQIINKFPIIKTKKA